jgi:hypothetical protein
VRGRGEPRRAGVDATSLSAAASPAGAQLSVPRSCSSRLRIAAQRGAPPRPAGGDTHGPFTAGGRRRTTCRGSGAGARRLLLAPRAAPPRPGGPSRVRDGHDESLRPDSWALPARATAVSSHMPGSPAPVVSTRDPSIEPAVGDGGEPNRPGMTLGRSSRSGHPARRTADPVRGVDCWPYGASSQITQI